MFSFVFCFLLPILTRKFKRSWKTFLVKRRKMSKKTQKKIDWWILFSWRVRFIQEKNDEKFHKNTWSSKRKAKIPWRERRKKSCLSRIFIFDLNILLFFVRKSTLILLRLTMRQCLLPSQLSDYTIHKTSTTYWNWNRRRRVDYFYLFFILFHNNRISQNKPCLKRKMWQCVLWVRELVSKKKERERELTCL